MKRFFSGRPKGLCRLAAWCVVCALLLAVTSALDSCGRKETVIVWVYSDEYRQELENFLRVTGADVRFKARIRTVNSGDFADALRHSSESGKDTPDVFMLSPDNITSYVESDLTQDVTALGLSVSDERFFPYVVQAATSGKGVVKAVGWQADPGLFMYRRSMARVYLGTDNPDAVQAMVDDWDSFYQTALKIKEASAGKTRMLAGQEELLLPYLASDDRPWAEDGRLVVSDRRRAYVDYLGKMTEEHLLYPAEQWSEAWLQGIRDSQSVFGYFSSGICMQYVMKKACGGSEKGQGSYGDWAVVPGPASYCRGGSWFAVYSGSRHPQAAADFISLFTACTDDPARLEETVKYFRITGEFAASSEVVSQIRFDPQFEDPFIGGQNYYQQLSIVARGVSMEHKTVYDNAIYGIFNTYMNEYAGGLKSSEQALRDFRTSVKVAFPELDTGRD